MPRKNANRPRTSTDDAMPSPSTAGAGPSTRTSPIPGSAIAGPLVHPAQDLDSFQAGFWRAQMDAVEREEPDFKPGAGQLPLARIKKVMKSDQEVKMISAEAPILFARACEIFIADLTCRAYLIAEEHKRRTVQRSDVAGAIGRSDLFDFLIDIVPREESAPAARLPGGAVARRERTGEGQNAARAKESKSGGKRKAFELGGEDVDEGVLGSAAGQSALEMNGMTEQQNDVGVTGTDSWSHAVNVGAPSDEFFGAPPSGQGAGTTTDSMAAFQGWQLPTGTGAGAGGTGGLYDQYYYSQAFDSTPSAAQTQSQSISQPSAASSDPSNGVSHLSANSNVIGNAGVGVGVDSPAKCRQDPNAPQQYGFEYLAATGDYTPMNAPEGADGNRETNTGNVGRS